MNPLTVSLKKVIPGAERGIAWQEAASPRDRFACDKVYSVLPRGGLDQWQENKKAPFSSCL